MSGPDDASERTLNGDGRSSTDTIGLYTALGVERDATQDELKRAYRRLALQHHPDRNPRAAGSTSEFVRIQYAYDVLSDARRRRIYNRYGEIGVQMAGRMGGQLLDPLVSSALSAFAFASAAVALLLIAFFALLARRTDHAKSWPFAVIFAPLWAVDLVLLAALLWTRLRGAVLQDTDVPDSASETNNDDDDASVDGVSIDEASVGEAAASGARLTDATPLLGAQSSQTSQQRRRRRTPRRLRAARKCAEARVAELATAAPAVYLVLLVAFQVSVVLRLDGHVDWTALRVATPWLAIEAVHFVQLTLQLAAGLLRMREQTLATGAKPQVIALAADTYWWLAIRVSLALLVAAKLGGALAWHWALVFAPVYLPALRWAVSLCRLRGQLRAMRGDAEFLQNEDAIVRVCVAVFAVVTSFVYSFVALVVWKLSQPWAVRLALVLIPVFFVLALACCCCSCFGLCLTCGIDATVETVMEREMQSASPGAVVVPAARRIQQRGYASLGEATST